MNIFFRKLGLSFFLSFMLMAWPTLGYEKTINQTLSVYFNSLTACKTGQITIQSTMLFADSEQSIKPDSEVLPSDHEVIVRINHCGIKATYLAWLRYQKPWYTLLSVKFIKQ